MLRTANLNILSAAIWIVSAPILFIFTSFVAYQLQQKSYVISSYCTNGYDFLGTICSNMEQQRETYQNHQIVRASGW